MMCFMGQCMRFVWRRRSVDVSFVNERSRMIVVWRRRILARETIARA
jgi:hypothetical protein